MTFYALLRLHKRIRSRIIKLLGLWLASLFGLRHLSLRLDPVLDCNLACQMCSFSSAEFRKKNKGAIPEDEFKDIARALFPRAFQLVVGCAAEPTKYHGYQGLFHLAQRYKVPDVSIVTNGQLLKKEDIEEMRNYGVNEVILSCHGVKKSTYEKFMSGASYEIFHKVLTWVKEIQESGVTNPKLRINYTANPDNLDELDDFFKVFGKYPIDVLQVRPVMDIGGKYRQQFTGVDSPRYQSVISRLEEACRLNHVTLLANKEDATYQEETRDADLAELVFTYISPKTAGQLGINWRDCRFRDFRKADQWTSRLARAFWKKGRGEGWLGRSLKYDVR